VEGLAVSELSGRVVEPWEGGEFAHSLGTAEGRQV